MTEFATNWTPANLPLDDTRVTMRHVYNQPDTLQRVHDTMQAFFRAHPAETHFTFVVNGLPAPPDVQAHKPLCETFTRIGELCKVLGPDTWQQNEDIEVQTRGSDTPTILWRSLPNPPSLGQLPRINSHNKLLLAAQPRTRLGIGYIALQKNSSNNRIITELGCGNLETGTRIGKIIDLTSRKSSSPQLPAQRRASKWTRNVAVTAHLRDGDTDLGPVL